MHLSEKVQLGSKAIASLLPQGFTPEIGIILGTGLGGVSQAVSSPTQIPYAEIPEYPLSTVASHTGRFIFGSLGGRNVVVQEGRCHLYEGYSPEEVTRGVRIMAALGAKTLIVTNAAGSLDPLIPAGSIMTITDHINFTGQSPLAGLPEIPGLDRFPDMSAPYDQRLLELAHKKALELGMRLEKGVYLGLLGPQLETRAETRMFRAWGADAVGMSSVMEVIAARHLKMKVLGLSTLSNQNLPDGMAEVTLEEIIETSKKTAANLEKLLLALLPEL
ncbi:purine-nucleoside phosphorylase [Desulfovibrio sp. OttesenSCG-928-C06]|nr:purine-nucleoside phosphorylase [Desulfovibrio sp. OttesenSCG-928-C06]